MLEHLSNDFRELLKQLDSTTCPLCGVLKLRAEEQVQTAVGSKIALCGVHLQMMLGVTADPAARARQVRHAIETLLAACSGCGICAKLEKIESRLMRAIRRMDGQIRFRKALEAAPFFCREHAGAVTAQGAALDFAEVQKVKISRLRDALAQAELLKDESLENLISSALLYLGKPEKRQPGMQVLESPEGNSEEIDEFSRWEAARQIKYLAALESEAASLRYRNAVLSEENRGLKLAYTASEAACRHLELDRSKLLAALKNDDSNPLKQSTSH